MVKQPLNILMISNLDHDEKLEDLWLARAFQADGHHVAIVDKNYDPRLEDIFDLFLRRNCWSSHATVASAAARYAFARRIIDKDLPRINFDGKFDGHGKQYLVDLYRQGYPVIPTIVNLADLPLLKADRLLLKLKNSYDGLGQRVVTAATLKDHFNDHYVVQPFLQFQAEVQFYFIKDQFEYALAFIPSKVPVYPAAVAYTPNAAELALARRFAALNGDYYGIQRIDFIKLADGQLLLTEIEDIGPYLDLDRVTPAVRTQFINDYKNMVYTYWQNRHA